MKSQNSKEQKSEFSYKETLNLLKTDFSMLSNSVLREPEIQNFWAKNKTIDESFFVIFLFLTVLVIFYLAELFFSRWYQLTDNEKKKLTTFLEFKNNFSKILEAINLGFGKFTKPSNFFNLGSDNKNTTQKKWVRNDKNDNIKV